MGRYTTRTEHLSLDTIAKVHKVFPGWPLAQIWRQVFPDFEISRQVFYRAFNRTGVTAEQYELISQKLEEKLSQAENPGSLFLSTLARANSPLTDGRYLVIDLQRSKADEAAVQAFIDTDFNLAAELSLV